MIEDLKITLSIEMETASSLIVYTENITDYEVFCRFMTFFYFLVVVISVTVIYNFVEC